MKAVQVDREGIEEIPRLSHNSALPKVYLRLYLERMCGVHMVEIREQCQMLLLTCYLPFWTEGGDEGFRWPAIFQVG